jgi:hypothetical protein
MRHTRLAYALLPVSILAGALSLISAACGGSSASGSGGGSNQTGDCFDYTGFAATTPTVTFSAEVLPIFRRSCGISTACHGCDNMGTPGCTSPGYQPYLGTSMTDSAPTPTQIAAIITSVQMPAALQTSTFDQSMVGDPDMAIVSPSHPEKSFMLYKLDGSFPTTPDNSEVTCSTLTCAAGMSCGSAMPSGGPGLSSSDRDTIRRWIAQGAMNN